MDPTNAALTKITEIINNLRNHTGKGYITEPAGSFSIPTYPNIRTRDEIKHPPELKFDPHELRELSMLGPGEVLSKHEPAFAEVEEDLIGAAFVVAQAHLVREKMKGADEAKVRVNHVANYFKHHMEWPLRNDRWEAPKLRTTFDALTSLQIFGPGEERLLTKLASWALTGTFDRQLLDKRPRWTFDGDHLWQAIS